MSHVSYLLTVDFGASKCGATGSSGVGYTVYDSTGSIVSQRTTNGVKQVAPGIYSAEPFFPDVDDSFQVVWDTGDVFTRKCYASEVVSHTERFFTLAAGLTHVTDAIVDVAHSLSGAYGDIQSLAMDVSLIRDFTAGRWKMMNNQMIFYKEDNVTEIARYDLLDQNMRPSMDSVFERKKTV